MQGRILGLRLFLEGQEVPVIASVVSGGLSRPAMARVRIPAADSAHSLLPRTLVHLFYMDSRFEVGAADKAGAGKLVSEGPTVTRTLNRDWLPNWKLLFVGEVLGYSYSKIGGARHIVLSCQDCSSYWAAAKIYWGRQRAGWTSYKKAIFLGSTHIHKGGQPVQRSSDLLRILMARPSTNPTLPGLLGGIVGLLEATMGVFSPENPKTHRGVNDFMSQAEMRLKLTHMIGASAADDSSATFINSWVFRKYFSRLSKAVKSTASFMQLVDVILKRMYHVWSSVPAPPYFTAGQKVAISKYESVGPRFRGSPTVASVLDEVRKTYEYLNEIASDADQDRGKGTIPKAVDYIQYRPAESMATGEDATYTADYPMHKKAIVYINTEGIGKRGIDFSAKQRQGNTYGIIGEYVRDEILARNPRSASAKRRATEIMEAFVHVENARRRWSLVIRKGGLSPHSPPATPPSDYTGEGFNEVNVDYIRRELSLAQSALEKGVRRPTRKVSAKQPLDKRLNCFLFHPDLYMVPPPRCNVLFPDHIQSISFSRSWMSEVSRLWLHGRYDSGRDKKDVYFSPNAEVLGIGGKTALEAVKGAQSFVMRHEVFSGIVPSILGLGDNAVFKTLHKKDTRAYLKEKKEALSRGDKRWDKRFSLSGEASTAAQPHLQRAANFMFFAQRYSSRTMRIQCRFSPQLVTGLPCLVLDPQEDSVADGPRPAAVVGRATTPSASAGRKLEVEKRISGGDADDRDLLKERATSRTHGVHYIGTISSIEHNLNAAGGATTTVYLVKCRAHNEGNDIFNQDEAGVGGSGRRTKSRTTRYVKSSDGTDLFLALVLRDPIAKDSKSFTKTPISVNRDFSKILGKKFDRNKKYTVEIQWDAEGTPKTVKKGEIEYAKVKVKEHTGYTPNTPKKSHFTFEGMTIPPWFSSIYWPANIGPQYYEEMVGCGSVLDGGVIPMTDGAAGITYFRKAEEEAPAMVTVDMPLSPLAGTVPNEQTRRIDIPRQLFDESLSTKAAAEKLAKAWLLYKSQGADMNLFIDLYNKRRHATIPQILARKDLDDAELRVEAVNEDAFFSNGGLGDVEEDGFHAYAYSGKYRNLKPDDKLGNGSLVRNFVGSKARRVSGDVDPRADRYERVAAYLEEVRKYGHRN